MDFRLVDSRWNDVFADAASVKRQALRIVCPFIKQGVVERLVKACKPSAMQVITRFSLEDFFAGVSDLAALRFLVANGAQVRGVKNLHAKLYLFGDRRAIVTSANLTEAALARNHEFGCVADDPAVVGACRAYFDALWRKAGRDLTVRRLDGWQTALDKRLVAGGPRQKRVMLPDEGVDAGFSAAPEAVAVWTGATNSGFVKFFGLNNKRDDYTTKVLAAVKDDGCHWACTYPRNKRPRQQQDGDIMFMGKMMKGPNDIMIFGRAIAVAHKPGRDEATKRDKEVRTWKSDWPNYVRVHDAEFINGTLADGVSLNAMMARLGSDSFASTQRARQTGKGCSDPRMAYRQQADVKLSPQGVAWMTAKLEAAFAKRGKIPQAQLDKLDWPEVAE